MDNNASASAGVSPQDSQVLLRMENICKTFPGVKALDHVSLTVRAGTVHALMGENGAGKSTLMKCLFGVYNKDEGHIYLEGQEINFKNSKEALENGVAMVHQELKQAHMRNVMDNIWLGRYPKIGPIVSEKKMYQYTMEIFNDLDIHVNPKAIMSTMPVSQRQMVEIAKALAKDVQILVLDEPTASLTEKEVDVLMDFLDHLRQRGVTCIYISHKLEEVFRISDRISVLRDGQLVSTYETADVTEWDVIRAMVGRELEDRFPYHSHEIGEPVLQVRDLSLTDAKGKKILKNISFDLCRGEILGISGLMGAGRTEMAMTIFGAMEGKKTGTVMLFGEKVDIHSPADAISRGIALVTEDRKAQGLLLAQTVSDNIVLASLRKLCHMGVVDVNLQYFFAKQYVKEIGIKVPSLNAEVRSLSGGNQQKVVLAKWLMTEPKILILDEPTRGIDGGAKYEIYTIMMDLAAKGFSIIMISSELPEIMGMSDRVLVMHEGAVSGTVLHEDMTQERIMRLATGGNEDE